MDHIELELWAKERGKPKYKEMPETYEQGRRVARVPCGAEYQLRVLNGSDMFRFVVKAYSKDRHGQKRYFLLGRQEHSIRTETGIGAFKPLLEYGRAVFKGFETRYNKGNYMCEKEWHTFQAKDEEWDLSWHNYFRKKGVDSPRSSVPTTEDPIEDIFVDVFENAGYWTYNRGGGSRYSERDKPENGSVTVPGVLDGETFACPPADKRWESAEGEMLGTVSLGVAIRR